MGKGKIIIKTKIKVDKLGVLPFIALSVLFHILFIWMCFYSKVNKDFFVQVPFEVSFYSPVENKTYIDIDSTVEKKKTIESIKKEKIKESKNTKDVMLVKKGKKKIYKKEQKVKEEQTKEEQTKEGKTEVRNSIKGETSQTSQKISATADSQVVANSKTIMFENKNFKYSYYTNTIVKKIRKYWQWSQTTEFYRAVVYFRILKDGSIDEVKIKESSKNEEFDQNVIRTVKLSSPFAPLPLGYTESYLGVYFEFKYN